MTDPTTHRPLSEIIADGPVSYDRFLELAVAIVKKIDHAHQTGVAFDQMTADVILVDDSSDIRITADTIVSDNLTADLRALGRIFGTMLTGFAAEGEFTRSTLERIYPYEARVLVDKLLESHPSGQFLGSSELLATLREMQEEYQRSGQIPAQSDRVGSPKVYLVLSLLTLLLLVVWVIYSTLHR